MKVVATDSFAKSLRKLANTQRWWRWEFYQDKYLELKWRFWAFKNYRKVVMTRARPWDYNAVLHFMKKHFELLSERMEHGWEVDETKNPKVEDIKRCIVLLNNIIEDNYSERCGYDFERNNFEFVEVEGHPDQHEMVHTKDSQTPEEIREILAKSRKLEQEEWEELWDIIKKGKSSPHGMQGWWD